jgi:hypothetical protein
LKYRKADSKIEKRQNSPSTIKKMLFVPGIIDNIENTKISNVQILLRYIGFVSIFTPWKHIKTVPNTKNKSRIVSGMAINIRRRGQGALSKKYMLQRTELQNILSANGSNSSPNFDVALNFLAR